MSRPKDGPELTRLENSEPRDHKDRGVFLFGER